MLRIKPIFLFLLLLAPSLLHAQPLATMIDSVLSIPCSQSCFTLHADIYDSKKTSSYTLTTPTYNPQSYTGGTSLSLSDDKFSNTINIGFNFCFYENTYSSLVIGANGIVTFNPAYAGQNCSFSTQQTLPYFNSTFADNAIFGPFVDINLSQGGDINYYTTGTAPWRAFVVNFHNTNYFSTACPTVSNTFQIILHESSNEIEVNIQNKGTCNTNPNNWLNYASLGIQNIGATQSNIAPGKNASIWNSSSESFLFSPAGAQNYNITWYQNGLVIGGNYDTVNICSNNPEFNDYYFTYTTICPTSTVTDSAKVSKPKIYPDSVQVTRPSCYNSSDGQMVIFPASPYYQYKKDNNPYGASNVFSNLGSGLHTFYMKDSSGCVWDSTIQLLPTTNLYAVVDSARKPLCGQMNGEIYTSTSGGVPPYTYSWNLVSSTSDDITGVGSGSYVMTVSDSIGCQYNLFHYLEDISGLHLDSLKFQHPACGDSSGSISAYISGGTPPYTYNWSASSSTTNTATGLLAGNHSIVVLDSNGCDTTLLVPLVDLYVVTALLDTTHTTCGLDNGVASVTPLSGLAPFSYSWSGGGSDSMKTGLSPGFHFCTITGANGCDTVVSFYVNSSISPSMSLSWTNAYCDSNNGIAVVYISDMTPPLTYAWSSGATQSKAENLAPGWAVITVTDSLGCVMKDSVWIDNDGSPHLEVVEYKAPLCHGDSTGTVTLTAHGGTPPYKYSIDGSYFQTTATLNSMPGGTYPLYVRDANSCTKDTLINFPQPDPIEFELRHDSVTCFGDAVKLYIQNIRGGQGSLRTSLDAAPFRRDTSYGPLDAGSYHITVQDSAGCEVDKTINIVGPNSALGIDFSMTEIPCYQETGGEITATPYGGWGGYDLLWSNGSTQNSQSDLPEGWYSLRLLDDYGCLYEDSVKLEALECCEAWLPSAFTPNGDGNNDYFQYYTRSNIEDVIFEIRNRYGEQVFFSMQTQDGWDGRYNDQPAEMGVYVYSLRYKCRKTKDWIEIHGDMTLIR